MVKQKFIAKNTSKKAIAILRVSDKVFELKPGETIKFEALPNEQIIYPAGIIEVKVEGEDTKETKKAEPKAETKKAEPKEEPKVEEQKAEEAEKTEEPKKTTKRGRRAKK